MEITSLESEYKRMTAEIKELGELLNQSLVIMEFLYTLDIKEYQDKLNEAVAFKRDYAEIISRIHKQLDETVIL